MKVLHVNFQGTGIGHFRHWLPATALRAKGHEVIDFPNSENALSFIERETEGGVEAWLANVMKQIDVIHLGYTTSESSLRLFACAREYAASQLGRNVPLITDIDDDILHVPTYSAGFSAYHGGSQERRIAKMQLQISDAVTVSTAPLGASLAKLCKRVYVLPNCFDSSSWNNYPEDPKRAQDHSTRLLFAGGRSRIGDLETLRVPLEQVMATRPSLRLFFLGCAPVWASQWMKSKTDAAANRAFILQNAPLQSYWALIRWLAPDIVVNPLQTNEFNKSKSCIKAWDAILGQATYVGTDYPTHDPIPDDVMYKCVSPLQWTETLSYLVDNPVARKAKAMALKDWGLANYHIRTHIGSWENAYTEVSALPVVRELTDTVGG
jgi:hypothetical protein